MTKEVYQLKVQDPDSEEMIAYGYEVYASLSVAQDELNKMFDGRCKILSTNDEKTWWWEDDESAEYWEIRKLKVIGE